MSGPSDLRLLVLAPRGRDAAVVRQVLGPEVDAHVCADMAALVSEVAQGAGAVIVTEEALAGEDLPALLDWIRRQEPWSDLPFVILSAQRTGPRPQRAQGVLAELANVVLLERPINAETLQRGAASTLRARRRQYLARDHITERVAAQQAIEEGRSALQRLNQTLERRIEERTRDLAEANERLLREIDEKEQMHSVLVQSQKMEAVGQLTGGVAHDFNNLLTIIRASVDFLRRDDISEARRARYIDAISQTVDRAAKLTGQLLAFARRQALTPVVFDVGRQVESVADLVRPLVGARITIEMELCPEPCFAEADVSQFETALINLAANARDAMDGEGRLSFKVQAVDSLPAVRGHAGAAGAFVSVSVSDDGCGIAPDQIANIFEPFYTTKDVGKGTGLGLSQVFGFAKQSGGEVNVDTAPGHGAIFRLYLPRVVMDEPARLAGPAGGVLPERADGLRILVVEDNEAVGEFALEMLSDLGHAPVRATNADMALGLLGQDASRFDAVFSDVVMPGMNGVQMARLMRERFPALPILLTSGYSNILAQEGSHGFELLHKPYSVETFVKALGRVSGPAPLALGEP